ncbi:hypothetical protein SNOG_14470 [Parastagonospora nodorum SN15]|uniref:Uncharacterized protein n=1 Tax=Phaeosphaeria nodorum (strain SN15 / ATCC MYA-4574 / FGSC 10173) TaxID=321614 RepID=Q0U0V7_PHANO|nr:hypothetical protein SNOG_14470 [Parastagonospora nodorum SN15]EAT78010.1 hypothetical protein SNOG_14470 [Parastagonospora nodorum SN15]
MEKWPIVLLILPLIICLGHLASLRETGFKHIETRDYPASIAEEQPSALFEVRILSIANMFLALGFKEAMIANGDAAHT